MEHIDGIEPTSPDYKTGILNRYTIRAFKNKPGEGLEPPCLSKLITSQLLSPLSQPGINWSGVWVTLPLKLAWKASASIFCQRRILNWWEEQDSNLRPRSCND